MKIIITLLYTLVLLLVLFLYSACIVSSRCSREEEKYEAEIFKRIQKRTNKE